VFAFSFAETIRKEVVVRGRSAGINIQSGWRTIFKKPGKNPGLVLAAKKSPRLGVSASPIKMEKNKAI